MRVHGLGFPAWWIPSHRPDKGGSEGSTPPQAAAQSDARLSGIERYDRTTHFVGNQLARVEGDTATAETYCLAHHIHERDGVVVDRTLAIRYRDRLVRAGDRWRFAERILVVDWESEQPL